MVVVEVIRSELVAPSEATPRDPIWSSNLDLAARRGYSPTVYFYRPSGDPVDFFSEDVLKTALAKTLVRFYPFAGRLGVSRADGRIEISCTAEGALFVVARADAALDDFNDFAPSAEMRDLFVPPAGSPDPPCILLMLQVTYLKCGGVALGTSMHHTVIDARSAFHFISTWAAIARGGSGADLPPPPFLDHTLLRARSPPHVLFDHPEYKPAPPNPNPNSSPSPNPKPSSSPAPYASAILRLSQAQVDALKARCCSGGGGGGARVSAFRAIVAHVWRCVCAARGLARCAETRLYTMVDVRARLAPPLPPNYFGNAVLRTSVAAAAGELADAPLGAVARRLRAATSAGDEYARSLVDFLEGVDLDRLPRSGLPGNDLRVISWMGMSIYDADFGWGEPVFMGPALMYYAGFVYLMSSPGKVGGVSVAVSLEPDSLPTFKKLLFQELGGVQG